MAGAGVDVRERGRRVALGVQAWGRGLRRIDRLVEEARWSLFMTESRSFSG